MANTACSTLYSVKMTRVGWSEYGAWGLWWVFVTLTLDSLTTCKLPVDSVINTWPSAASCDVMQSVVESSTSCAGCLCVCMSACGDGWLSWAVSAPCLVSNQLVMTMLLAAYVSRHAWPHTTCRQSPGLWVTLFSLKHLWLLTALSRSLVTRHITNILHYSILWRDSSVMWIWNTLM